jgi:large subunit ribosomal protein L18
MISRVIQRKNNREKRRLRIRRKVKGTSTLPRLSVFRSNKYIYGQIIDDVQGTTLVAVSGAKNLAAAKKCGELLAQQALKAKIKQVVFDRGGYRYMGRIAQFAQGARQEGLEF